MPPLGARSAPRSRSAPTSPFRGSIPPYAPSVAWDSTLDQYLVVWSGITGECCEIDYEIFSRRVTALGVPLGAQLQISHMSGPVENPNEAHYDAYDPAVVYNPAAAEFLVVWSGDEGRDGYLNDEFEIRGQRIDAATGAQVGADDFPVSDAGSTSNIASSAYLPDVAYNLADDEYLVTWGAEDPDAGTADGEFEIFGQRLDGSSGAELGTNDFRISTVGPPGNTHYFTIASAVAYDAADNEYLVAFCATEYAEAAFVRAFDVFGQRLDSAGAEIGVDDFRLSDFGEFGDPAWNCEGVDVAYSAAAGAYLVSFSGDDNRAGQLDGELEVFVQMVDADSGTEVGPNDLRVSDMGPNGSSTYQAFSPVLAADTSGGTAAGLDRRRQQRRTGGQRVRNLRSVPHRTALRRRLRRRGHTGLECHRSLSRHRRRPVSRRSRPRLRSLPGCRTAARPCPRRSARARQPRGRRARE